MDRLLLALFTVLMIPLLILLDRYSGFKETSTWLGDVADGFVAYGVGFAATVSPGGARRAGYSRGRNQGRETPSG